MKDAEMKAHVKLPSQLAAATLGNAVEWYDFSLYAFLAPIIAKNFFPTHNSEKSLLLTFGVFALGFLARPIGAVLFGHIGDKFGRRLALLLTTCCMTLATIALGLLPTYQSVGVLAPILLLLVRLFQGLTVSGELSGSSTFLLEHAHRRHWGFAGSLITASVYAGQLLGAIVGFTLTSLISKAMLVNWAWRLPFLLAVILGVVVFVLRWRSTETPSFEKEQRASHLANAPVSEAFRHYKLGMVHIFGILIIAAVAGYMLVGFLPSFLIVQMGFSYHFAFLVTLFGQFLVLISLPIVGSLSDAFGRRIFLLIGTIGFIVLSIPIFWLFSSYWLSLVLFAEMLFALLMACINGVVTVTMAEMFPTVVRYTGIGIAYNIALAVFGSTAPLIAEYVVNYFHSQYAVSLYLGICGILSLPFIMRVPRLRLMGSVEEMSA
ncbi:MAG: MFS transporter [Gammaproteobacteria bacterium]|nr:MFS transporter [Gammaproteobacteria bacterium]